MILVDTSAWIDHGEIVSQGAARAGELDAVSHVSPVAR